MFKQHFINAIGKHNYLRYVRPLSDLYHSACVPFKADGLELIKHHLIAVGGIVLDIGANIGQFTAFAAPIVGRSGHVYSFEPVAAAARTFTRMVTLRRFRQVHLVNVALSCRTGRADIQIPLKDGWKPQVAVAHLNGVGQADTCIETVQLHTLDGFCKEAGIERVDFIKCDTEGHEFFVFAGGINTLATFRPAIFCEVEKPYVERSGLHPSSVFGLLERLGYQSYLPTSRGELAPVAGYQTRANYFFLHPARVSACLAQRIAKGEIENMRK